MNASNLRKFHPRRWHSHPHTCWHYISSWLDPHCMYIQCSAMGILLRQSSQRFCISNL